MCSDYELLYLASTVFAQDHRPLPTRMPDSVLSLVSPISSFKVVDDQVTVSDSGGSQATKQPSSNNLEGVSLADHSLNETPRASIMNTRVESQAGTSSSDQDGKDAPPGATPHEGTYAAAVKVKVEWSEDLQGLGETLKKIQNCGMKLIFSLQPHPCQQGEGCRTFQESFKKQKREWLRILRIGCPKSGKVTDYTVAEPRRISDTPLVERAMHGGQYWLSLHITRLNPDTLSFLKLPPDQEVPNIMFQVPPHECETPATCNKLKKAVERARQRYEDNNQDPIEGYPEFDFLLVSVPLWTMVAPVKGSP